MIDNDRIFKGSSGTYIDIATRDKQTLALSLRVDRSITVTCLTIRFASRSQGGYAPLTKLTVREVSTYRTSDGKCFKALRLNKFEMIIATHNRALSREELIQVFLENGFVTELELWIDSLCHAEGFSVEDGLTGVVSFLLFGPEPTPLEAHVNPLLLPSVDKLQEGPGPKTVSMESYADSDPEPDEEGEDDDLNDEDEEEEE